jgi:hypothetical protein
MAVPRYPPEAPADAGLLTIQQVSRITQLSPLQLYRIAADRKQARRFGVERLCGNLRFRRPAIEAIVGKIEADV